MFLPEDTNGKERWTRGGIDGFDKAKAKLFFPMAGFGDANVLSDAWSWGCYWSSSRSAENGKAYGFFMHPDELFNANYQDEFRYGCSVRPVHD